MIGSFFDSLQLHKSQAVADPIVEFAQVFKNF